MKQQGQPRATALVQRLFALFGAASLVGAAGPAPAAVAPDRAALEARVARVRADLVRPDADGATPLVVAAGQWNNWPNWSNWAKWANG